MTPKAHEMKYPPFIPTDTKLWRVIDHSGAIDSVWLEKENALKHVEDANKRLRDFGLPLPKWRVSGVQTLIGEVLLGGTSE